MHWTSIQRVMWCDPRQPPVPHSLQRGHGCRHISLDGGGGANRVWQGGTWLVDKDLAEYFYADDGLVVWTQLERLQKEFDFLASLFGRVSLRENIRKMVSMACQPCHAPVRVSLEVYERWTTGTGPTFREPQRRRVDCPEFKVEVTAGSLLMHHQIQHAVGQGGRVAPPPPPGESQTNQLSFLRRLMRLWCPV